MSKQKNSIAGETAACAKDGLTKLQLSPAPATETGGVKAWEYLVMMRPYMPAAPDPNPLFLEKRVYPLPVIDRVDIEPQNHRLTYGALRNRDEVKALRERAVAQQGDFQRLQVHAISDTTFSWAMALKRMGKTEETATLFKEICDYSMQLRQQTLKIDCFATSLPTMLLFDENLNQCQDIQASFLQAQALVGMRETESALTLLKKAEQLDRNHAGAADLIASLAERAG